MTPAADETTPGAAELRRGDDAVRTAVAPGGLIESVQQGGVEWVRAGAWREHGPTIGACTMPTYVGGIPGMALPAGGVLGTTCPEVTVRAEADGQSVRTWWPPGPFPAGVERMLSLDADGGVRMAYEAGSAHGVALPFVWGLTMPLAWDDDVRLELPAGARARVVASWGEGLPAAGSEFTWPSLRDGGRLLDLSHPSSLGRGRGVLCYVALPRGSFRMRTGQHVLEVAGTPGVVTHARVYIEHEAPLPGRRPARWWRRQAPRREIVVGPAVGAPDALSDAVGGWQAARWIDSGSRVQWEVTVRGIAPEMPEAE